MCPWGAFSLTYVSVGCIFIDLCVHGVVLFVAHMFDNYLQVSHGYLKVQNKAFMNMEPWLLLRKLAFLTINSKHFEQKFSMGGFSSTCMHD
jgi:hypothetical protein